MFRVSPGIVATNPTKDTSTVLHYRTVVPDTAYSTNYNALYGYAVWLLLLLLLSLLATSRARARGSELRSSDGARGTPTWLLEPMES